MKKLTIWILLLFATTGMSTPQQGSPDQIVELQSTLERYKRVSLARDVEGLLSFLHPGLFTQMPKEQMRKMMTDSLASGEAPVIQKIAFEIISPIRPYSQGVSVVVGAFSEFSMQRPGDVTPDIDALMIGLIKQRMGGEVETSIDEQKNVILIKKKSWMLGIKHEGEGWKFIDQHRVGFFFENKLLPADLQGLLK